ncbi:MAG: hypothetical protein MUC29_08540 [Pyrinomonadaceae bacterium]|jgi:hypothetical protein|nr:hypothetical protein [Pyrinomonadaceae bacterium]
MKKHILGIALFSLIVGVLGVMLSTENLPMIYNKESKSFEYPKYDCVANESNQVIKQAVFDKSTRTLDVKLCQVQENNGIRLNLFAKDANGVRFVKGFMSQPRPELEMSSKNVAVKKIGEKIDIFDVYADENLYIIPELFNENSEFNNAKMVFDEKSAVSVLIVNK